LGLVCLVLVWHRRFGGAPPGTRRAAWALLIVTATSGPLIELATVWARNVVKVTGEPIGPRLTLLASSRGPFIFDSIEFHPDAATRDSSGVFTVGDPGQRSGAALFSRPMWLAAGQYRVGYRIDPGNRAPDLPMATLDVTADSGSRSVGRRVVAAAHLESRPDGRWVWLDFDLAGDVRDVRLLLASTAPPAFRVTGIALEKR
jgi:hypothetical protein